MVAPGFRAERIENVQDNVHVFLRPGLPVRLELSDTLEALENDGYRVTITFVDPNRRFLFGSDQLAYARKTIQSISTRLSRPGRYRVTVGRFFELVSKSELFADHEIIVRDVPTEQVFVIPVTTPKR